MKGRIKNVISYIGGKNRLKRKLLTLFKPHDIYVEPFLGGGTMLLWKTPAPHEWVADLDDLIINLWRVLKHPDLYKQFVDYLTMHPKSRTLFYKYREMLKDEEKYTVIGSVVRAAMAYFIIKSSFGTMRVFTGKEVWGSVLGTDKMVGFYNTDWELIFWRLKDVIIENRDFRTFLPIVNKKACKKTPGRRVFCYCDPPYVITAKHPVPCYRYDFTIKDHEDLAELLHKFRGYFLLSIDDCEESRELYKDLHITEVETVYMSENVHEKSKRVTELAITNYQPPKRDVQELMFA